MILSHKKDMRAIWGIFIVCLSCIFALWLYSRPLKLEWQNVPPAPTPMTANAFSLGDKQFSYRFLGMLLQSFGNTSGRYEAMNEYHYDALAGWFDLLDSIDPDSEYLPFLVSYYFGATNKPEQLKYVTHLLDKVGQRVGKKKWRWLTQAIYIARYKMKDFEYARELAAKLKNHSDPSVGAWAKNMDAYISEQMGDKQAAIQLTLMLLKNNAKDMTHQEIYLLSDYVCNDLMNKEQSAALEMCKNMAEVH